MQPPEKIKISISLSLEEAVVLDDILHRYHESEQPELVIRADWRALILLAGHLERSGVAEIADFSGSWRKLGAPWAAATECRFRSRA